MISVLEGKVKLLTLFLDEQAKMHRSCTLFTRWAHHFYFQRYYIMTIKKKHRSIPSRLHANGQQFAYFMNNFLHAVAFPSCLQKCFDYNGVKISHERDETSFTFTRIAVSLVLKWEVALDFKDAAVPGFGHRDLVFLSILGTEIKKYRMSIFSRKA